MTPTDHLTTLLARLGQHPLPTIDLRLDRMLQALSRLGSPHLRLPPVIHVAGTNGKGSTIAFLHAMLEAAGLRVHRYTSPHLVHFNERIVLAGKQADDATLADALDAILPSLEASPLTYFESTTALAFHLFATHPADVLLLEVGMGGRLDATNVVESPLATIITPVSLDHQAYLGDTLGAIAREKAGIIKREVPCIIARQQPEALDVIETVATTLHAPLLRAGVEWDVVRLEDGRLHYRSAVTELTLPPPALPGAHQYGNAGAALACLEHLRHIFPTLDEQAMTRGIAQVRWPGRLERVAPERARTCWDTHHTIWLDGGHNPDAAAVLANWIAAQATPVHIVMGMHTDKDAAAFLRTLSARAASVTLCPIAGDTLAMTPPMLSALVENTHAAGQLYTASSLGDAIAQLTTRHTTPHIVLVTGSLYLAGEALSALAVA